MLLSCLARKDFSFLLAKRLSTLDHLTEGRIGWNIVTSWKKAAFKAIGIDTPIDHDERYARADEYLRKNHVGRREDVRFRFEEEYQRGGERSDSIFSSNSD